MSVSSLRMGILATAMLWIGACGGARVEPPDVKLNPSPKERYEISIEIKNLPDAILGVSGRAQFNIKNRECMPLADRIAGIKPDDRFNPTLAFIHHDKGLYIGHLYADLALSENYYGLGTCEWEMTSVQSLIRTKKLTQYARLPRQEFFSQGEQENLCELPNSEHTEMVCSTSSDQAIIERLSKTSYIVVMKSRKISP